ncbi:chromosome condensation complex Condensin, subunit G [Suhomyces tanzawaensis NRRL Y-17324]|uniref:Chromosome condensation complex Condensin, subunit G n=1 Tax=Suhomyces tanzawaensis NRRL Y-17324 TaxID=984487 RepID=A0A1E4SG49_9ASCO|nr:chromosome condensation complex Condensin, subunit G [Suhomyces tanzawaensis NRRL Y-17324]ODV78488.1 chromosome condensation complex Condensin, subunit G [Suhomyces tanzawaensis NRRL Y-17324]
MNGPQTSHQSIIKPTLDNIKRIETVDEIRNAVSHVFQDAQLSLSGHRKLVLVMKNIMNKAIELNFAEHFAMYFTKLINKILPLKKGEQVADRIAKFCSSFVASVSKDDLARRQEKEVQNERDEVDEMDEGEEEQEEDTYVSAFIKYLIHHLLRGVEAKDKNVRYRVVQILAYLVYYIGEIDHDTFEALYTSLNKRLNDKEPTIRIQAVVAISRFQSFNFDFDDQEDSPFSFPLNKDLITSKIVSTIQNDDNAEVRRAAILNLTKNQTTIPYLIDRSRDVNSINRRLIFSRISRELGDFKNIDFTQREFLLKWGMNDRNDSVKQAAVKMVNTYWYSAANEDILELIEVLRVTESKVADLVMSEFFKGKEDKLYSIKIDDSYWKALTVEKAFLMRTFYYHCNDNNYYDLIDSNFPESIDLAETLEKYLQLRIRFLSENDAIIKKYEDHEQRIEFVKSQLFTVENALVKIRYEVEAYKRNLRETTSNIEDYEELAKLIKKRLSKLKANDESYQDLLTEDNEQIVEQLIEFSPEELVQKQAEIKSSIKSSKAEVKETEKAIIGCESRFKQGTEKYHSLSKEKLEEQERFSQHDEEYLPFADELKELEFIIEQLMLISKEFDFSDEIGRRKMLQIIRKSLTEDKLSSSLISIGLQVLRKISINEKDFITMATEIITDIRDSYESDDETFHSAISGFDEEDEDEEDEEEGGEAEEGEKEEDSKSSGDSEQLPEDRESTDAESGNKANQRISSRKIKKRKIEPKLPPDEIVIRCLRITQNVLELIEDPLENHISLGSIYSGLVNYAIKYSEKYTLHLQGLTCLGLFALIDKNTAQDAISTFFAAMRNSGEDVRIIGIKAIIDILSTYGTTLIDSRALYQYGKLFYKSLNSFDMPKLQCVVAEGLCKLFLADVFSAIDKTEEEIDDERPELETEKQLFEALILSYFHPLTQENQELRQILAFCIPVYAFSHPKHQFRLSSVSGDCMYRMFNESSDFLEYENKLSPLQVVQQLIYWCDPNNLVNMTPESTKIQTSQVWQCVYLLQVVEQDTTKAVKKAILNNLTKISITPALESKVLKGLLEAIEGTKECYDQNTQDPEFQFDRLTLKNFEAFETSVKELYEAALAREISEEQATPRSFSRASSILEEIEDSKDNLVGLDEDKPSSDETGVIHERTPQEANDEEDVNMDESKEKEEDSSKKEIDNQLKEIDQMLDEEDDVEYDIPMVE